MSVATDCTLVVCLVLSVKSSVYVVNYRVAWWHSRSTTGLVSLSLQIHSSPFRSDAAAYVHRQHTLMQAKSSQAEAGKVAVGLEESTGSLLLSLCLMSSIGCLPSKPEISTGSYGS